MKLRHNTCISLAIMWDYRVKIFVFVMWFLNNILWLHFAPQETILKDIFEYKGNYNISSSFFVQEISVNLNRNEKYDFLSLFIRPIARIKTGVCTISRSYERHRKLYFHAYCFKEKFLNNLSFCQPSWEYHMWVVSSSRFFSLNWVPASLFANWVPASRYVISPFSPIFSQKKRKTVQFVG